MEMSILIAITTFKKNDALDVLVKSLVENRYKNVVIADDNSNICQVDNLLKKYKNDFENLTLKYNQKTQQTGISCNKNRCIKHFLENDYDHLLMLDDDIKIVSPKIEEHFDHIKNTYNIKHVSGYWTDENVYNTSKLVGLTGNQWSDDFPTIMENKDLFFTRGCQGCFVWVYKDLVKEAGYFRKFPYFYGTEHAEYSARLNKISGWAVGIENEDPLFPMLKRSEKYFHGQFIPNNYNVDHQKIEINMKKYREYLDDTRNGISLYNDDPGLPRKEEVTIDINKSTC